ncbi:hypothetical protein MMC13_001210 [Lambiella insularis]|nr:hypothetical protein [Lambiella insularis]
MTVPSSFFSLPAELRQEIYLLLLTFNAPLPIRIHECGAFQVKRAIRREPLSDSVEHFSSPVDTRSSILLTCRRVHAEAQPLLYSSNTFILPQWPPVVTEFSKRGYASQPCSRHSQFPQLSHMRKTVCYAAQRNWHLVQGLLHLLQPSDPRVKTYWRTFPLEQLAEIGVGFARLSSMARTKACPHPYQEYQLWAAKGVTVKIDPEELVGLLAELYARGGVKVSIRVGAHKDYLIDAFVRAVEANGRGIGNTNYRPDADEGGDNPSLRTFESIPKQSLDPTGLGCTHPKPICSPDR